MSDKKLPLPLHLPCFRQLSHSIQARTVEARLLELAEVMSRRLDMSRRSFLAGATGMAAAFLALNSVHGNLFLVDEAEAADPEAAAERLAALKDQFVFDVQTHFVSDNYTRTGILGLRELARQWNPQLKGSKNTLAAIRYENFLKEVFDRSETTVALLSSAPSDNPEGWFLKNPETVAARQRINAQAGSRRLLAHAVFTPGQPGWLDELDKAIALKPDSWKGYSLGSPSRSRWPWRLDDEKLAYPAYEKMLKAGIPIVCIHKGLLPANYQVRIPNWRYAGPADIVKAAKDWPQLTFVIYHSAIRTGGPPSAKDAEQFEKNGYIPWVSELARIPEEHGVKNLYAELGSVFAVSVVSNPRYCSGILGTLIKGFGHERVLWGTDSVWYGSPQWQIEALRRMEIPQDLQKGRGFKPLGSADGEVKRAILGGNAARLYGMKADKALYKDRLAERKHAAWVEASGETHAADRPLGGVAGCIAAARYFWANTCLFG